MSNNNLALKTLEQISHNYKFLWTAIEKKIIKNHEDQLWDKEILLPYADWLPPLLDISTPNWKKGLKKGDMMPINGIDFTSICAIGTWRYSKGIYKVDDLIAKNLINTDISIKIPSILLLNQPEWSMYVDTSNFDILLKGKKVIGFWSNINCFHTASSTYSDNKFLIITPLLENGFEEMLSVSILLNPKQNQTVEEITESIPKILGEFADYSNRTNDQIREINDFKKIVVQILLFISQPEPDISEDEKQIISLNNRTYPVKIKSQLRFFEAKKIRKFNVGFRIGNELRQSITDYLNSGKKVEPHLRRAHWHGYWKGSRKQNKQIFFYQWIRPLLVNPEN
ncbi:hypothetical protein MMP74_03755 [Acinetobacter sp. NIPH 1869]|uniref:AcrVA2 family anti-CRISPR protein n=1 Tax=Acinetobacter higginsii TaxID=70347 RepID=UPI001F4B0F58|nr:hypothetical protein [Acinetobacter higginsii]MCH7303509.1 hypothetical protein [Acinetobacter higginsii]